MKAKFFTPISNIAFLIKAYLRHSKLIAVGAIAASVIVDPIASYILATFAQAVIDKAAETKAFPPVLVTAVIYFAVYYILVLGNWLWVDFFLRWKIVEVEAKIEREIYEHAIKVDLRHMDNPKYYDTYKIATEELVMRSGEAYSQVVSLIGSFAIISVMTTVLARSAPITIVLVVAAAIIELCTRVYWGNQHGKRTKQQIVPRRRRDYVRRLMFNTATAGDVRSTRLMERLMGTFNAGIAEQVRVMKSFARKEFAVDIIQTFSRNSATFIIALYVAYGFAGGKMSDIGVFATLMSAASILSSSIQNLSYGLSSIYQTSVFGGQAREFFNVERGIEYSTGEPAPDGELTVELREVTFAYPESEPKIKRVSLTIASGEKVAIVGENGAGKTTLSKLLLRLYDVSDGAILINGRDIREYDIHQLRSKIGVAFQQANVYPLTLAENLSLYRDCAAETLDHIIGQVRLTKSRDELLTREFDDKGSVMSGGEAQKIAVGRLLAGNFGLLILDEPSSSLDPLAEYEMAKLMFDKSRKATMVMIAHRLSTVIDADKICLVSDGEIAEQGTHAELMRLNGKYAEMFNKQAENYLPE
ncbi:MAG: ABC transporter ATP-binding protein/permease [Oscillospiraceae bacterium]|jgi:ATP-binding cassette subfamily B protein|nr:ABC transporter ATP-binding protein/permease [Oscillospiraceae bacterium]